MPNMLKVASKVLSGGIPIYSYTTHRFHDTKVKDNQGFYVGMLYWPRYSQKGPCSGVSLDSQIQNNGVLRKYMFTETRIEISDEF